jgi:hypothetical protein
MNHLIEDKTAGNIISGDDGKIMRFSFDSFVDMIVKVIFVSFVVKVLQISHSTTNM